MAKRKNKQKGPTRSKKPQAPPQHEQPHPEELLFQNIAMEERMAGFIKRYREHFDKEPPKPLMDMYEYILEQVPKIAFMVHASRMQPPPQPVPPPAEAAEEEAAPQGTVEATPQPEGAP